MLRDALRCWYTGTHYVKGSQNTGKPCALGSFSALKAMHELKPRQLGPAVSSWRALPQLIRSFGNLRTLEVAVLLSTAPSQLPCQFGSV